jgi:hypothetical protein
MFFGIIIRMYFAPKEHNPPHIHVFYNENVVVINILNFEIMEGEIPTKQLRLVLAWIEITPKVVTAGSSGGVDGKLEIMPEW